MNAKRLIAVGVATGALAFGCGSTNSGSVKQAEQPAQDTTADAQSGAAAGPCAGFGPGDSGEQGLGGSSSTSDDASVGDSGTKAHAPFKADDHACGTNGQCVQGPFCTPGGCTGANQYSCVYEGNGTNPCWAQDNVIVCGPNAPDAG